MKTFGLGAGAQTAHLAFVPIEKTGKCGVLQPSWTINRQAQLVAYDTTDQDDMAFGTALGCEGHIEISIEPLLPELPWTLGHTVQSILDRREPIALATVYRGKVDGRNLAGQSFTLTAAQAKLLTGRLAVRATEEAVQIHGGYGFIEEYPVCRFYRDAKILTIGEGTDEVQQMVIARQLGC